MSAELQIQAPAPARAIQGVIPYLVVDGAAKAAAFYARAFGATELGAQPPDDQGRTMHIHLQVNGASLMLCDGFPEYGEPVRPHQGYSLVLPVADTDTAHDRAVDAGAQSRTAPENMFWGDRYAEVVDPFGVRWAFNGPPK